MRSRGIHTKTKDPLYRMRTVEKELATGKFDLIAIAAMAFKDKQLWFLDQVSRLQKPWGEGCIRMEVRLLWCNITYCVLVYYVCSVISIHTRGEWVYSQISHLVISHVISNSYSYDMQATYTRAH